MGKASLPKTSINDTLDANKERKKQFGRERGAFSRVSGVAVNSGSGVNATSNNVIQVPSLQTAGGTMMGPIAFYPRLQFITSPSTTLDISKSTGTAYSSRVIVSGSSSAATVSTISGAAHAGQILFLQAASAQTITINETGNISIPGSTSSYVMTANEIILLQYDTTTTKWITVNLGSGGGSSSLLTSNNTWTGTNTFTGTTFASSASTSTSITSPQIYIGDQASDTINITGAVNVNGDIDMNTYDIFAVDRVKFSTTTGSGSALTSTDTGIEALYNSGNPYGMLIQFPSTNSAVMQIKRGSTEMINISSLGVLFGDELLMGGHKITNLGTPTSTTDAATKAYVDAGGGGWVGTATSNLNMANYDITNIGQVESDKLVLNTSGVITLNTNNIIGTTGGIEYNVPSGDKHKFLIAGQEEGINIDEDEIEFAKSGRQHRISVNGSAIQIVAQNQSDSVELTTGTSRTNPTIDVNDTTTTFRTTTTETTDYRIQIIQNNNTPANFRTISNIDFMAENSSSVDTEYARISASSNNITNGAEDGLLQLGVVSDGTLVSGIDIEGGTSGSSGAKIGFFGESPVVQQTVSSSASVATVITALKNLGLFV
tara:strand:+ start:3108 stop:4913 length:1806 start_codon:yes stop_codon:yes gene_type:complete